MIRNKVLYDVLVFMQPFVVSQCGNQTQNFGSEPTISVFKRHSVSTFEKIGRNIFDADVTSGTLPESAMHGTHVISLRVYEIVILLLFQFLSRLRKSKLTDLSVKANLQFSPSKVVQWKQQAQVRKLLWVGMPIDFSFGGFCRF